MKLFQLLDHQHLTASFHPNQIKNSLKAQCDILGALFGILYQTISKKLIQ